MSCAYIRGIDDKISYQGNVGLLYALVNLYIYEKGKKKCIDNITPVRGTMRVFLDGEGSEKNAGYSGGFRIIVW